MVDARDLQLSTLAVAPPHLFTKVSQMKVKTIWGLRASEWSKSCRFAGWKVNLKGRGKKGGEGKGEEKGGGGGQTPMDCTHAAGDTKYLLGGLASVETGGELTVGTKRG